MASSAGRAECQQIRTKTIYKDRVTYELQKTCNAQTQKRVLK